MALLTGAAGCQTDGFKAANLPQQYRVAAKPRRTTLNLARLAGSGAGNTELAVGDLLEVTIATGREGEQVEPLLARVAADGSVGLPLIGPVAVAQLEPDEAGQRIAARSIERGIYRRPHVTLDVKTRATNKVTVLGAVTNPGTYEIPRGASDLAAAIGAAGGLTEEASEQVDVLRQSPTILADSSTGPAASSSDVQLAAYRQLADGAPKNAPGGQRLTRIDLAAAPNVANDVRQIADRDVVMVLPREKEVLHVAGLVNHPGQFDLPHDQDVHLLDAVSLAGGVSSALADRVIVIRQLPGETEPLVIQAKLSRAKRNGAENIRLTDGDLVSVERTPATVLLDTFKGLFRMSVGVSSKSTFF